MKQKTTDPTKYYRFVGYVFVCKENKKCILMCCRQQHNYNRNSLFLAYIYIDKRTCIIITKRQIFITNLLYNKINARVLCDSNELKKKKIFFLFSSPDEPTLKKNVIADFGI